MHHLTEMQVIRKKIISETICNKKLALEFFSQGNTTITTITKIQMTCFYPSNYRDRGISLFTKYLKSIYLHSSVCACLCARCQGRRTGHNLVRY